MRLMYAATHNLAEPAGSLALAGLLADVDPAHQSNRDRNVAIIHTGGNADFDVLERALNRPTLKGTAS